MVFSDLLFIFVFLPFFIVTYILGSVIDKWRINKKGSDPLQIHRPMLWRNISLLIFSLLFYSWGEPVYVLLMLISIIINYIIGLLMVKSQLDKVRKLWLIIGVAINLGILGIFKYYGFFANSLTALGIPVTDPKIALPIGISFYIFQSISYLVDVYRRESPVQKNIFDLMLYIAMFPQLIAGPIVRYGTVANEINYRKTSLSDISDGSYRFFIGLGKKVIFANILGEIASLLLNSGSLENLSFWGAWFGIIAFTLQIYFDFSGYSDMAIGMGTAIGFHFPENFNHPYISKSITEFWRRWHMSLGSFYRDYLYIPMGGNRKRQILNIMTVWFLTGMWHGAYWNYIIWGLYFGLVLLIEKYTVLKWKIPGLFRHIGTLFLIITGWGIFYFEDFGRMKQFFHAFFGFEFDTQIPMEIESIFFDNFWIIICAIILCLPIRPYIADKLNNWSFKKTYASYSVMFVRGLISITILLVSIVLLVGATNNAFIYTRF